MSDRCKIIDTFLAGTVWHNWKRHEIAGDASARRYGRLSNGGQSVILMDAPPDGTQSNKAFVEIAQFLTAHGLSAPHVMAHDVENGLMILTDLGEGDFASWLKSHPDDTRTLYQTAADVLLRLQDITPPDTLVRMTPAIGADMIVITGEYYTQRDLTGLCDELRTTLSAFAPVADTLALRDFHVENLIWRAKHSGLDRVGLLDFQDAFVAPAGYDLASLLRDARRDVPESTIQDTLVYFAAKSGAAGSFRTQVACLGVQRNLRILGVFARLSKAMNKPRYLQFLPRVWAHIMADLDDPALAMLRQAVLDTLPAPTAPFCESLMP